MVGFVAGAQLALGGIQALSGLLGSDGPGLTKQIEKQLEHSYLAPAKTVAGWENAGINPLAGIGSGAVASFQPSIGDRHATNGALFSSGLDLIHDGLLEQTALAQENDKLRETIDDLAKPNQPGHLQQYGGILPLPSEGGANAQNDQNVSGDLDGLHVGSPDADAVARPPADARVGGLRVTGTGLFEKGETYEEEFGEPASWLAAPLVIADAIVGTGSNYAVGAKVRSDMRTLDDLRNPKKRKVNPKKRPKSRPVDIPDWGTPEWADHMRRLYQ